MKETDIDDHALAPGDDAAPGAAGSGENVCPACGGSGVEESGGVCPDCQGSGRVVQGVGGG